MKKILDGERPPRPQKGKKLGLSDDLWEIIQSSLAHEAEKRPPVSTFLDVLEEVTPDIAALKELTEFDGNSEEHVQELRRMFGYGDNTLLGMREEETLVIIEVFDRVSFLACRPSLLPNVSDLIWFQVLNSSLNDPALRSRCLRGLQKVSARCGLLPESYWISHSTLVEPDGAPSATAGVSSTRQRLMDGKLVAVKAISPNCVENFDAFKRVCLRISKIPLADAVLLQKLWTNGIIWKRLQHPNVVPFLGFGSVAPPFSLVYPWMSNGSLSEYVRQNPSADKLGLVRGHS